MILLVIALIAILALYLLLRSRNMHLWIIPYLLDSYRRLCWQPKGDIHIYFAFVDHYEPYRDGVSNTRARELVSRWKTEYPAAALRHRDSDGKAPQHTFFYPEEEYDSAILDDLKIICEAGVGDVEIHLHHHDDTASNLNRTLVDFATLLHDRHGFLQHGNEIQQPHQFAFIHGNWALDNSDGGAWCGVDNELSVLVNAGCYMDMTFPSAPSATQPKKINSIYFAKGKPGKRQSHNKGIDLQAGSWGAADELLLVQGPLMLNWRRRKFGLLPTIEAAEISADAPPSEQRIRLWEKCRIRIKGADSHLFIKLHTHGAVESTMDMLFKEQGFDTLWDGLEKRFRDRPGYQLHYVTARDLYEKLKVLSQAC